MLSFVLLVFAFIPTDGAVIRTKQVLSVFDAVVDMYVHIIFTCIKSAVHKISCLPSGTLM